MGRKPAFDWSAKQRYVSVKFNMYEYYRFYYQCAYRANRNPSCKWFKCNDGLYRGVITLDCNTVTGATKHAQYCRKVREGKI